MSAPFLIKREIVGTGPATRFAVYEDLGLLAGHTWRPWFTSYDEDEARRYAAEAAEIVKTYGRIELSGRYWCEVSPRSGSFGPQFNIYHPAGFFGLGRKLVNASLSLEGAEAWAARAVRLAAE